jgi:RNA polymerase sigma-70 factor (ECF subfamily)
VKSGAAVALDPRRGPHHRRAVDLDGTKSVPEALKVVTEEILPYDAGRMPIARPDSHARLMREAMVEADGLYNLARHLSRDAAEAQDLVQETYARALGAATQFKDGSNLKAWLFRILRNTFIDLRRLDKRQRTDGGLDTVADQTSETEGGEPRQLRQVLGRQIEAAMSALGEDARLVILLDLEGFNESEIAECLGCPAGTVKSRLFRARAALRARLNNHGQ